MNDQATPGGLASTEGLGARVPTRDDVPLWGNIVLLHLWGAVGYMKPGFLPTMAGVMQIVILLAMIYQGSLRARLQKLASSESA